MNYLIKRTGKNYRIVLKEPIDFELNGKKYCVPRFFISDGMSVPSFLHPIIAPELNLSVLEPSIVHDFLYFSKIVSRKESDDWYRKQLEIGIGKVKACLIWAGLRCFGWLHW